MVAQRKEIFLDEPKTYVGIDVHKDKWVVSILSEGQERKPISIDGKVEQLKVLLSPYKNVGSISCVYESGFSGFWLSRSLEEWGAEALVVHSADIPTTDFERRRKSDEVDSSKLVNCHSRDLLQSIHIPSVEREKLRGILRARQSLSKDRRRVMCKIRSLLNFTGIHASKEMDRSLWSKKGINWLREQEEHCPALGIYLDQYKLTEELLKSAGKKLTQEIKNSTLAELYESLQTTPGVGWVTAATLVCELGEFTRFKGINQLASYCGLVPDVRSSAQSKKVLGISKRRNSRLRTILVESAWVAKRKIPCLNKIYEEAICQGKPPQKAIIKVARKYLNQLRAVGMNHGRYEIK